MITAFTHRSKHKDCFNVFLNMFLGYFNFKTVLEIKNKCKNVSVDN